MKFNLFKSVSFTCKSFITFATFTFLFLCHLNAQTVSLKANPSSLRLDQIGLQQGLSQSTVYAITQDSQGFMWFGTQDGLNRYDGYSITVFKHDNLDSNSISDNSIWCLLCDHKGELWIGTEKGGLNRYSYSENKFYHYVHKKNDRTTISGNDITSLFEDSKGNLWVGTRNNGLNLLNRREGTFKHFLYDESDSGGTKGKTVWKILEDSTGVLWIATGQGLYMGILNTSTSDSINPHFLKYHSSLSNSKSINSNSIFTLYSNPEGTLWLGTWGGGIGRFDEKTKNISIYRHDLKNPHSISGNIITSICENTNSDSEMWIGTYDGGLNLYNSSTGSFDKYSTDAVMSLYEDKSGILWIGTLTGGVKIFDKQKNEFIHYYHDPGNMGSLNGNVISAILEDRSGDLWIGVWGKGLDRLDQNREKITHYSFDPKDNKSIGSNRISAICQSGDNKDGNIWIGTLSGGLNRYDRKIDKFIRYKHKPGNHNCILSNDISALYYDNESNLLWIGYLSGGVSAYNILKNSFIHYLPDEKNPNAIPGSPISVIYKGAKSGLWIGTSREGVCRLIPGTNSFKTYHVHINPNHFSKKFNKTNRPDFNREISVNNNGINSIYEDPGGTVWIGTNGGGLNRYDPHSNTFTYFTTQQGLPNNVVYGILPDKKGDLWLSTNIGLSRFNPETGKFKNYNVKDGLQGNEFNQGAYYLSSDGEMFFGGMNGLSAFYPEKIKENENKPPIYITTFKVFDKTLPLPDPVPDKYTIRLSDSQNFFSFEFAALNYSVPEENQYAYMLEGFDRNWHFVSARQRYASYTNLDPGKYILHVIGSNNDGIWNKLGTSINIIILPPWWQTIWAYIFFSVFILGTIYFSWKFHVKRISIKHQYEMSKFEANKLHEIDEMKSRFFANISHEFRTPLTLIIGPVKQLIDGIKDQKVKDELNIVRKNANRLLRLVNQLLDISKLESGNLKLQTVYQNVVPLFKTLVLSFSSYAERKRIILKFTANEEEITAYIDKDKIEKIIINILSNAFKFTPEGGRIEVNVITNNDDLEISICDTGIGIPKDKISKIFDRFYQVDGSHTREQEGTGIGLALTKELVELHKGKIEVKTNEGKGTTFIISIPLGKDHLIPEEIIESEFEEEKNSNLPVDVISNAIDESTPAVEHAVNKFDIELITDSDKLYLLVVEDNSDFRKYIKDNLKKDYKILEAVDGMDGWNKSIEQLPDLIVSDVMMPKMDGFKLCEQLKTDERTSHIPVILLTAKASNQDKIEGFETGADDYIMKPFELEELKVRIKNLVEQRKRIREHFKKQGVFELEQTKITSVDKKFLQKVFEIIDSNFSDSSFNVESLAKILAVSRSVLHKKINAFTGEPPVELIKWIRINKAAELIRKKFGNISEISLEVGFNNPAYFSDCFKKQFGIPPSQYIKNLKQDFK